MKPSLPLGAPWYRQFWPWFLIALPAVSVVFSFATLSVALRHGDTLVRSDYYEAGLAKNAVLSAERKAVEQGISASLRIAEGTRVASVRLAGVSPAPSALQLDLVHATRAGVDRSMALSATPDGEWVGVLDVPEAGFWQVSLHPPDGSWQISSRFERLAGEPLILGVPR